MPQKARGPNSNKISPRGTNSATKCDPKNNRHEMRYNDGVQKGQWRKRISHALWSISCTPKSHHIEANVWRIAVPVSGPEAIGIVAPATAPNGAMIFVPRKR